MNDLKTGWAGLAVLSPECEIAFVVVVPQMMKWILISLATRKQIYDVICDPISLIINNSSSNNNNNNINNFE